LQGRTTARCPVATPCCDGAAVNRFDLSIANVSTLRRAKSATGLALGEKKF
jgi:hypothetical protein